MTEFFNTMAMRMLHSVQLTREVPVLNAPKDGGHSSGSSQGSVQCCDILLVQSSIPWQDACCHEGTCCVVLSGPGRVRQGVDGRDEHTLPPCA